MSEQTTPERVNYHCHCARCRHASGTVRDYALEALDKGLVRLGISDHLPYPGSTASYCMPYEELVPYLEDLTALREELAGRLELLRGFESEYFPEQHRFYQSLLARDDCDYLLLGQHFFTADSGERYSTFDVPDTALYEAYARSVVEAMDTGLFQYAAHPDLIFLNDHPWDGHCERACDIIVEGAVRLGFPIECNANGFRRGIRTYPDGERYPYPAERFWDKAAAAGVKVYVGSDCHAPELLWDGAVDMAFALLREKGLRPETGWPAVWAAPRTL